MATIIKIAYEESADAVQRVRSYLDHTVTHNPNWNGADFVIERDDYTCIEGEGYDAAALLYGIQSALR